MSKHLNDNVMKGLFVAILENRKAEADRAKRVQRAWQEAVSEVLGGDAPLVDWERELVTPWRGAPITPQSIRKNDLYDIHTAHGTTITGVLAGRNGVYSPRSGDQYRLVHRAA